MAKVVYEEGVADPVLRVDWHIEDIVAEAEEMGIALSKDDAVGVMLILARTHDARIGINWDVIKGAIRYHEETTND